MPLQLSPTGEPLEDFPDDCRLGRLDRADTRRGVVSVAVYASVSRLWQLSVASPLGLASLRPLDDLLAFDLGHEGSGTTELINVLNILGWLVELEPEQAALLEKVCGGALIALEDLKAAGALESVPPGARPDQTGRSQTI